MVLGVALAASGCAAGAGDDGAVLAVAASLSGVADEVVATFPGGDVAVTTGASSALREQVLAGAPVDVLVSADARTVAQLVASGGTVGEPVVLASNRLVLAVPVASEPSLVRGLADLAAPGLLVGVCIPQAPCGRLAAEAFAAAGVEPTLATEASDVAALRTLLLEGELDAGLVYATDVAGSGGLLRAVVADLGAATVTAVATSERPAAAALLDHLRSVEVAGLFRAAGFGAP